MAVLCNSIASRLKANPLRSFARQFQAMPSRFDSSQCHCQTMLCRSVPRPCIPVRGDSLLCHSFTPPCKTLLRPAFAVLCIASLCRAIAFQGASRRLISMPSHRVSLILNTSPSLCETSPSSSVAAPRQSPLFHCVAEIRIAPRSLCCSSGSKTELSLSYAVLGRAALRLSAAVLFNSLPFLCNATQGRARRTQAFAVLGQAALSSAIAPFGGPISPPFPPGRSLPPPSCDQIFLPCRRGCFLPHRASCR